MNTATAPLVARQLGKVFRSQAPGAAAALSDVSFELEDGEVLAIIGPNGAGKTTLVDVLATVLAPTCGSFAIAGLDAARHTATTRRAIGYVPSGSRSLCPRLTVRQNLCFFAALHGIVGPDASRRADAVLERCGAAEVASVRVDRLSDGMVARVTLARALLHDPAVLLLDEPVRSIDPVHRTLLLHVIRDYARQPGRAVVMVTHDIEDVFAIGHRVGLMQKGRLISVSDVGGSAGQRDGMRAALKAGWA